MSITILPQEITQTGLRAYITALAQRHGVCCSPSGSSELARVSTHLAGDDVKPDETERLVTALRQANVIDGKTMALLLGRHFDETRSIP